MQNTLEAIHNSKGGVTENQNSMKLVLNIIVTGVVQHRTCKYKTWHVMKGMDVPQFKIQIDPVIIT